MNIVCIIVLDGTIGLTDLCVFDSHDTATGGAGWAEVQTLFGRGIPAFGTLQPSSVINPWIVQ